MISRTKNTFDMYTALRKFDEPINRAITSFNPESLTGDELRDILKGLMDIKLCNRTRGFTASKNQLAMIEKNINAINKLNKAFLKLTRTVSYDSLLYRVSDRYNDITLNLNRQWEFYTK